MPLFSITFANLLFINQETVYLIYITPLYDRGSFGLLEEFFGIGLMIFFLQDKGKNFTFY